jgi:tetratricopeptide (TPR) repeat protein
MQGRRWFFRPILGMIALFLLFDLPICNLRAQDGERVVLTLPGLTWSLEIVTPGFSIKPRKIDPQGDRVEVLAQNPRLGIALTAFIEKAPKKGDAKAARDYYWWEIRKLPFDRKEARLYESGPLAIVEYGIPKIGDLKINQKHVNAYLSIDDYWAGIETSRTERPSETADPIPSILDQVSINRSYTPSILEEFGFASYFYLKNDFRRAAELYEKVLQRQGEANRLNQNSWRVLIDQLGMSYGQSDRPQKTQELLEWAIPLDPEYPMFYYTLACAFAEMGDPEKALANLRSAYQYRSNMLPGETFPDPKKDPSFKKSLKDNRFRSELEKIASGGIELPQDRGPDHFPPEDRMLVLSLPGLSWSLEITEPGFKITKQETNKRGDGSMLMATNDQTGVILSAFLEKAPFAGDAKACRDYYWGLDERSLEGLQNVRKFERGQTAVIEYEIGISGMSQKNARAFLAHNGYWIDVHLSKISMGSEKEDPFSRVLERIGIKDPSTAR